MSKDNKKKIKHPLKRFKKLAHFGNYLIYDDYTYSIIAMSTKELDADFICSALNYYMERC